QLSYWRSNLSGANCGQLSFQAYQVGAPGFEPGTSCSQSRRDTRLRYAPHENPTIAGPARTVNWTELHGSGPNLAHYRTASHTIPRGRVRVEHRHADGVRRAEPRTHVRDD